MENNTVFTKRRARYPSLLFLIFLLTACSRPVKYTAPTETSIAQQTATIQDIPTQAPTATLLPLAATVNGDGILLEFINDEILRYLIAYPQSTITQAFEAVVQNQVDLLLLSQAAQNSGFTVSESQLEERITYLQDQLGSAGLLEEWMDDNHYTTETFHQALKLAIEAEHQRYAIAAAIPAEMEQIELSQILVYDETTAQQIQSALDAGTDFDWLLSQYHPVTRGYLGWQARGTLLQTALEEVAFSLEIGQYSSAIQTDYGFHFIKVVNKEIRPLSVQNRQLLEQKAIEQWIIEQRNAAEISILATVDE